LIDSPQPRNSRGRRLLLQSSGRQGDGEPHRTALTRTGGRVSVLAADAVLKGQQQVVTGDLAQQGRVPVSRGDRENLGALP